MTFARKFKREKICSKKLKEPKRCGIKTEIKKENGKTYIICHGREKEILCKKRACSDGTLTDSKQIT